MWKSVYIACETPAWWEHYRMFERNYEFMCSLLFGAELGNNVDMTNVPEWWNLIYFYFWIALSLPPQREFYWGRPESLSSSGPSWVCLHNESSAAMSCKSDAVCRAHCSSECIHPLSTELPAVTCSSSTQSAVDLWVAEENRMNINLYYNPNAFFIQPLSSVAQTNNIFIAFSFLSMSTVLKAAILNCNKIYEPYSAFSIRIAKTNTMSLEKCQW